MPDVGGSTAPIRPTLDQLTRWRTELRMVLTEMEETFPEPGPGMHAQEEMCLTRSAYLAVERRIKLIHQEDAIYGQ